MKINEDFVSLHKYDEKMIWLILDEAMKNSIRLYIQSTGSPNLVLLSSSQLQQIRSNHPHKFKMLIEELTDYSSTRFKILEHFQLVNFSDLWIKKTEAETILNPPSSASSKDTPVSEHEKSTMLKIILGMAMSAYKFNPEGRRNLATGSKKGSIKADLEKMGFDITEDTIRKYLNEAVKKHLSNVVYED